jgi:hypothetical protein
MVTTKPALGIFFSFLFVTAAWNVKMVATTALLCAFGITPYIYLKLVANNLTKSKTWVFPVLRATGGFITAMLIQLLIQRQITILFDQYLVKGDQLRNTDVEAAGHKKKYQMVARSITPTWLLLCFLLIGLVASVAGYIRCFSVVQNLLSTIGRHSWLFLESGLSVMRLAIWAWNPYASVPKTFTTRQEEDDTIYDEVTEDQYNFTRA